MRFSEKENMPEGKNIKEVIIIFKILLKRSLRASGKRRAQVVHYFGQGPKRKGSVQGYP